MILLLKLPGDSKICKIPPPRLLLLEDWGSFALVDLQCCYSLLGDHFSYSSPFVLFYQNEGENQWDNPLDLLFLDTRFSILVKM